jgi:hypothetical protein
MNTMLIAEAAVTTNRANRYLEQLCQHLEAIAQARPQMPVRVEWSNDTGLITLGAARCTLQAGTSALILRAEAPDEQSLQQIEGRLAARLEQIGRRDQLTVTWIPRTADDVV